MKKEFDDFGKQGRYILRLINTCTDIKKECQFCGKPANLKNNRVSPYEIQMVCHECRKIYEVNPITEMYDEIPLINVKDHIISERLSLNFINLTDEHIAKINKILEGGYTKVSAAKYIGESITYYNRLINLYEKKFNVNIKDKLKILYKEALRNDLVNRTLGNKLNTKYNNISKIKLEKGITNRVICEKTGLRNCTISYICNGKTKPKNTTIVKIAEVLECSIADLFPEYQDFKDVNSIATLKYLMIKIYTEIVFLFLHDKERKVNRFLDRLHRDLNIPYETLRTFLVSTKNHTSEVDLNVLSFENVRKIIKLYNSYNIKTIEFNYSKLEEFEKWKMKMIPRKK